MRNFDKLSVQEKEVMQQGKLATLQTVAKKTGQSARSVI